MYYPSDIEEFCSGNWDRFSVRGWLDEYPTEMSDFVYYVMKVMERQAKEAQMELEKEIFENDEELWQMAKRIRKLKGKIKKLKKKGGKDE